MQTHTTTYDHTRHPTKPYHACILSGTPNKFLVIMSLTSSPSATTIGYANSLVIRTKTFHLRMRGSPFSCLPGWPACLKPGLTQPSRLPRHQCPNMCPPLPTAGLFSGALPE